MVNVLDRLQSTVERNRDRVAIDATEPVTYGTFWSQTNRFAGGLRAHDVGRDDTVVICVSDPQTALTAIYGTLRNGSVPVTVPPSYRNDDLVSVLDETGGEVLLLEGRSPLPICAHAHDLQVAVTVEPAALGVDYDSFLDNSGMQHSTRTGITLTRRADDDRALIAYVGRYDGEPLAVVYTHEALRTAGNAGRTLIGDGVGRHLGTLPLSRPIALCYGATATLFDGGTYCPLEEWDGTMVTSRLRVDSIDRLFCTPDQYGDLRAAGLEPGADGIAVVEPTPAAFHGQADGTVRLCGIPETGITHVRTSADIEADRVGSSLPTVETTALTGGDSQELAVAGPSTMASYYHQPQLTAEKTESIDGVTWIRTGASVSTAGTGSTVRLEQGIEAP